MNTFEITVQRKWGDGWPVVVEQSATGAFLSVRSEGVFYLDDELRQQLTRYSQSPRDYGTVLGQSLFRAEIRDGFVRALAHSADHLRVLLFVEADDLRTLRWERLCAPLDGKWGLLALNQRVPFSLYLPSLTDRRFPPIGRRDLRALILVANPIGLEEYRLKRFDAVAAVDSVRAALGGIFHDVLAAVPGESGPPTLDALCERITEQQYTLLHIIAHGRYTRDSGDTTLYLAQPTPRKEGDHVDPVTGSRLIERLRQLRGARGLPHFAFLSTCESASPEAEAEGALGGLAQRLVRELGMPAVVAMTEKVSLTTAQALAEGFYRRLREHGEVDRALVEACAGLAERYDVTVPALYSRLGGRPLFSDTLDRPLTDDEIGDGLSRVEGLLPERAPVLTETFSAPAATLRGALGAAPEALSETTRVERADALTAINNLCEEVLDLTFNGLALGQEPPAYDGRCPFRGLQPFRLEDREFFFGREPLVGRLLDKLAKHNFLAVLGASGCGKSSLVLAGLIPALQMEEPDLQMVYLTPGDNPPAQLEASLSQVPPGSTLLVVDQFEELFTLCTDETKRRAFLERLLAFSEEARVVITMRADFWGDCAPYQALNERMQARQELIAPMDAAELRSAMEQQARAVGLRFEADLAHTILEDVEGEPGAMPLLQHLLHELWKRRHGRWLRAGEYRTVGGVRQAIARTADAVYQDLSPEEQERVRDVLVRLTHLGEEPVQGEGRRDMRRRVGAEELVPAGGDSTATKVLVQRLADARLVVTGVNAVTGEEEVEVAHEALIRHWPRLRGWLDEDRAGLRLRDTIRQAAREWEQAGGQDESLLVHRGGRLKDAEALTRRPGFLNPLERTYVDACRERSRREQRRARLLAIGAAIFTIIVIIASVTAFYSNKLASSRELADAAMVNLEVDPELSTLLAIQALSEAHTFEAENALHQAMQSSRVELTLSGHGGAVNSVAFGPDGARLVTASDDGTAIVWDLVAGEATLTIEVGAAVKSAVFNPDGTHLAIAGGDGTVTVWNATSGRELLTLSNQDAAVNSVAFSLDGTRLAAADDDGIVMIWDAASDMELLSFRGHSAAVNRVIFSPDGTLLGTASHDGTAKVWDTASGRALRSFAFGDRVFGIAFSHDGARLAAAGPAANSQSPRVKVWDISDAASGQPVLTLFGHTDAVYDVTFSPDGERLATGSVDNTAIVWDVDSGQELFSLAGHIGWVRGVAFSPDGARLATASDDGTARVWKASAPGELPSLSGHVRQINGLAFSPDGKRMATASDDGVAIVWDRASGEQILSVLVRARVYDTAFSPDGARLATASRDDEVKVWDAVSGEIIRTLPAGDNLVGVTFSPDGTRLAAASVGGTAIVWNVDSGEELFTLLGHSGPVYSVAYSSDGMRLATASDDGTAKVWDAESGQELLALTGHNQAVFGVVFSPDGSRLATASWDRTAMVWDADSGQSLQTMIGHSDRVFKVAFRPDGTRLATASADGTTRVWNVASGEELLALSGHVGGVYGVAFSPDGKHLATAGEDGTVRRYVLDVEDLLELARTRITRPWRPEECRKYLHRNECPAIP